LHSRSTACGRDVEAYEAQSLKTPRPKGTALGRQGSLPRFSHFSFPRQDFWEDHKAISDARKIRDDFYANPNASTKHKCKVQENVEKLEKLAMDVISDNAEHVRAKLKEINALGPVRYKTRSWGARNIAIEL
jgi:hypothetical protein